MSRSRNPYKNVVTRDVIRLSEKIVTIIEDGVPVRIAGEFITFIPSSTTNTIDIPIGGQSGNVSQKTIGFTNSWTATFYVGTDGSYWERMDQDRKNGIKRPLIFVTSTKDELSRGVGERIKEYSGCLMTNLTGNDDMGTDGLAIATITGTYEDDKLIQGFTNIQGAV